MSIPTFALDPEGRSEQWSDVRVDARTGPEIAEELFARFPQLVARYFHADGRPSRNWFGLWREDDGYDLRHEPETVVGDDDRVWFVNAVGC